jgi:flagellar hook assembly protein FlgD
MTNIDFTVPSLGLVRLAVYDLLGREVKTLLNEELSSGSHTVIWDAVDNSGNDISSGVYIYRFAVYDGTGTNKFIASRKMSLVR